MLPTGGATGAVCPGQAPSVRGPPNSAGLIQIRSGSSVTFQSSFFKGFVLLFFFALHVMLLELPPGPPKGLGRPRANTKTGGMQLYGLCVCGGGWGGV